MSDEKLSSPPAELAHAEHHELERRAVVAARDAVPRRERRAGAMAGRADADVRQQRQLGEHGLDVREAGEVAPGDAHELAATEAAQLVHEVRVVAGRVEAGCEVGLQRRFGDALEQRGAAPSEPRQQRRHRAGRPRRRSRCRPTPPAARESGTFTDFSANESVNAPGFRHFAEPGEPLLERGPQQRPECAARSQSIGLKASHVVRAASTAPATSSPAASMNAAPGTCQRAPSPMKYANVPANRLGPIIVAMPMMLPVGALQRALLARPDVPRHQALCRRRRQSPQRNDRHRRPGTARPVGASP